MRKGEDFTGVTVVYFCHDGAGRVLLGKRSQHARDEQGRWDIGGGGLEFGDTAEATLRREIKEEYCADVLAFEFLGFRDVLREREGKRTHWVALDFKVRIDPAGVAIGEPHKFDDLQWFTLATLPEPIHSQFPTFFERYRDRLEVIDSLHGPAISTEAR